MYSLCKYRHGSTECPPLIIYMNMQTHFFSDVTGSDKILVFVGVKSEIIDTSVEEL